MSVSSLPPNAAVIFTTQSIPAGSWMSREDKSSSTSQPFRPAVNNSHCPRRSEMSACASDEVAPTIKTLMIAPTGSNKLPMSLLADLLGHFSPPQFGVDCSCQKPWSDPLGQEVVEVAK